MRSLLISPAVFEHAPSYSRCVFTVQVPDGATPPSILAEALMEQSQAICSCKYVDERIAEWEAIYKSASINPNRYPPSLKSLVKRCRSGNSLPYINDLVAIMNLASLLLRQPCGGDDLDEVGGRLEVGPANGDEVFTPLGAPDGIEQPKPGEIAYLDRERNNVLCRRFNWRNGHQTRLSEKTSKLLFNVDIASGNLFLIRQAQILVPRLFRGFLGAETKFHLLDHRNSKVELTA